MATLTIDIPDDILQRAGITEREMKIELACRLYGSERLTKTEAARLCGLSRIEFEDELIRRNLPVIRYTAEMLQEDLNSLDKLDGDRAGRADGAVQS